MQNELKRTENSYRCIGTVNEIDLKREECEVKLWKDGQPNGSVPGERIRGRVSVNTGKNGIHTFDVFNQIRSDAKEHLESLKDEKEYKSFKNQMDYFHMFEEMMNWIPAIGPNASAEPTLVSINGSVGINDYVNQRGEISSTLRWNVRSGNTRVSPEDPKGTTLKATVIISNITPEVRQEEETGRLIVTMYGANNNGTCFPITAIVAKDMADDFVECYETGMTVPFDFELVSRHIGAASNGSTQKKFGRSGEIDVNRGFDVTELIIVGGDDEIEEPDELTTEDENGNEIEVKTSWINPVVMKKAIKARTQMLEELKKNGSNRKSGSSDAASSLKAKKAAASNSSKFGKKSASFDDFEDMDDDMPF